MSYGEDFAGVTAVIIACSMVQSYRGMGHIPRDRHGKITCPLSMLRYESQGHVAHNQLEDAGHRTIEVLSHFWTILLHLQDE